MNAIELLTADHRTVEALFSQVKASSESKHRELFKTIKGELDTHAHIEETIFYPRLEKEGKKDLADITREAFEEHKQMHTLLNELDGMGSRDKKTFEAKLTVLIENVEHHATEEEDEMFPMVEDKYSEDTLEAWGTEMQKEKLRFQKANGITPAPRKAAKGTIGTIIDQAMEVVTEMFTGSSQESGERAKTSSAGKSSGKSAGKSTAKSASSGKSAGKKSDGKKPAKTAKASGNGKSTAKSSSKTSTSANGGTRSTPPRVAGNGNGESKSTRSRSASGAKKSSAKSSAAGKAASKPNSGKKTSPTKSDAKRTTRANAT
jgi:hemerythrin superfamily protein